MKVQLSTGPWHLDTDYFVGMTCYEPTIFIDPERSKSQIDYLDTCIHEAIHASRNDLSEQAVVRLASDIATVLWALGFRQKRKSTRPAS